MYMQIVTITSQGQITVPALMRKAISLEKFTKAMVKVVDNKIIFEPIVDVVSLGGVLKHKAKKNKHIGDIIKDEERIISKMIKK